MTLFAGARTNTQTVARKLVNIGRNFTGQQNFNHNINLGHNSFYDVEQSVYRIFCEFNAKSSYQDSE